MRTSTGDLRGEPGGDQERGPDLSRPEDPHPGDALNRPTAGRPPHSRHKREVVMLMEILLTLVVGLIVGAIARFVMPGAQPMGWIATILLGIGGAFVGGLGGQALGLYKVGDPAGWIGAIVGAVILLLIYRMIKRAA